MFGYLLLINYYLLDTLFITYIQYLLQIIYKFD